MRINQRLSSPLDKSDINALIKSDRFVKAVDQAWRKLEMWDHGNDYFYEVTLHEIHDEPVEFVVNHLSEGSTEITTESREQLRDDFIEIVIEVTEKANLNIRWLNFVEHFVAFSTIPEKLYLEPERRLHVDRVMKGTIVISLDKGLSANEYNLAWKEIKKELKQLDSSFLDSDDTLRNIAIQEHKDGLSYGKLAKKYYPSMYAIDPESARDRVRKLIKRGK